MKKVSAVLGMVMAMNTIAATGLVVSADNGRSTGGTVIVAGGSTGERVIVAAGPSGTSDPSTGASGSSSGGSGSNDDFSDWDQPTDKELDDAKQKAEKEQEKKEAKEEAAAKKREELINQGGAIVGTYVGKLIAGKYENSDEAKNAALNAAGKIFKDCVLKNIPYAGGCISSLFGEVTGIGDADPMAATNAKIDITNEKLTEVNKNLEIINNTIKETGDRIIDNQNNCTVNQGYLKDMNTAADELYKMYDAYNTQFVYTMQNINNINVDSEEGMVTSSDDNIMRSIFSYGDGTLDGSYKLDYYNAFVKFDKAVKNNQFISSREEHGGGKDLFVINDEIAKAGKLEYLTIDGREAYVDSVNAYYSTGYEVLTTAMQYEKEKLALSNCVASAQIVELNDMINSTSGDTSALQEELMKYTDEVSRTNTALGDIEHKLKYLEDSYNEFQVMVNSENVILNREKQKVIDQYSQDYAIYMQVKEMADSGNADAKAEAEKMKNELGLMESYYTNWTEGTPVVSDGVKVEYGRDCTWSFLTLTGVNCEDYGIREGKYVSPFILDLLGEETDELDSLSNRKDNYFGYEYYILPDGTKTDREGASEYVAKQKYKLYVLTKSFQHFEFTKETK